MKFFCWNFVLLRIFGEIFAKNLFSKYGDKPSPEKKDFGLFEGNVGIFRKDIIQCLEFWREVEKPGFDHFGKCLRDSSFFSQSKGIFGEKN